MIKKIILLLIFVMSAKNVMSSASISTSSADLIDGTTIIDATYDPTTGESGDFLALPTYSLATGTSVSTSTNTRNIGNKIVRLLIVENSKATILKQMDYKIDNLSTSAKSFQICDQGAMAVDVENGENINPYIIAFDKISLEQKWQAKVNFNANAYAVRFDKNGNIFILSKLIFEDKLVVSGFDKNGNILTTFADNGNLIIDVPNFKPSTMASMRIIEDIFVANVDGGLTNDTVHIYKINLTGEIVDDTILTYKELTNIVNAKICKSFFFEKLNVSANGFDTDGKPKVSNVRLNFDLSIDTTYADDGFGALNDFLDSPSDLHDGFGYGFVHLVSNSSKKRITYSAINENGNAEKQVSETGNIQLPGENMKVASIYHSTLLGADIVTATQNPGDHNAKLFIYTITYPALKRSNISASICTKYCNLTQCGV